MKKIILSEIDKSKKYKLFINNFDISETHKNVKVENGSDIIQFLKRYYNIADMITDEQDFPRISKVKDEKSFFEYLQNRKSPGCDKIELFEV